MSEIRNSDYWHKTWYIIGLLIFIIGGILNPVWFFISFSSDFSSGEQFLVPSTKRFMLETPGKYVLWHDAKTFFKGKTYSFPPELPGGVTIRVIMSGGKELMLKPSTCTQESSENQKRHSICSFSIETPGEYILEVKNLNVSHVFTLRKSLHKAFLYGFFLCGPLMLISLTGAPLLIIIIAAQRSNYKKHEIIDE